MPTTPRRWLVLGAQGLALTALVAGSVTFIGAQKSVAVTVDGNTRTVNTFGSTVSDALRAAQVGVDERDRVSPALSSPLADGTAVDVRLSKDVLITVDGTERTVDSAATTVGELAAELGLQEARLSLPAQLELASATGPLTATTTKRVSLLKAGVPVQVESSASNVAGLLAEQGIAPDADDRVTPSVNTALADGASVEWVDVRASQERKKEKVAFASKETKDPELPRGEREVRTEGVDGEREVTYDVVRENGKEVSRKEASAKEIKKPVAEEVTVGTQSAADKAKADAKEKAEKAKADAKKKAKAEKERTSSEDSEGDDAKDSSKASSSTAGVSASWKALAKCESGGNWKINTGNGYYGGLQFSASSWRAVGGTKYAPLPHQASPAEQVKAAEKLRANGGWGHWPACSAKLGLR